MEFALKHNTADKARSACQIITVTEPRLLLDAGDTLIASYVENHQLADRSNHRVSTVVFTTDAGSPNGLRWRRVHETWRS